MLSASVDSAMEPPVSPPALDDMIPSAEPPMVKPPMATPPAMDEMSSAMQDSSGQKIAGQESSKQRSKEDEELGNVLASASPRQPSESRSQEPQALDDPASAPKEKKKKKKK